MPNEAEVRDLYADASADWVDGLLVRANDPVNLVMTQVARLRSMRGLIGRPLTDDRIVDLWIEGLGGAGIKAKRATGWTKGGHARTLDFVIGFSCPHRTGDGRSKTRVHLLIEADGWPVIDAESPCPVCDWETVERRLFTCSRCDLAEITDEHAIQGTAADYLDHVARGGPPGMHHPLVQARDAEVIRGSVSAFACVLWLFGREFEIAWAEWWNTREDEAEARARGGGADDAEVEARKDRARALGQIVTIPARKPDALTDNQAADWLDVNGVPLDATVREMWEAIKDLPGRPPKNQAERAQAMRRGRATPS